MCCKICGSELSAAEKAARFCQTCGSRVAPGENEGEITAHYYPVEAGGVKTEAKPKHKINFIPAHLIAAICLAVLFISVWIFFALRDNIENINDRELIKLNELVEPSLEFQMISHFSEGLAVVARIQHGDRGEWRYGYIDITGELVIACEYWNANDFFDGMALVYKDGKSGFIDKTGEVIIPLIYDHANAYFSDGLAAAAINNKWGYINTLGETIIPFEYDWAEPFIGGLAIVSDQQTRNRRRSGVIDTEGNRVIPFEYDWIWFNHLGGFYHVTRGVQQGLFDKAGNEILPCIYNQINFSPADGLIYVKQGNKWGIFEIDGYEPPPDLQDRRHGRYW
jgi:hypothetical protein